MKGPDTQIETYCIGLEKEDEYYVAGVQRMNPEDKCDKKTLFGEEGTILSWQ